MPEFFEEVGTVGQIAPKFWPALSLLQEGNNYSQQTTGNLWEFAVEIAELRQYGLSDNDLRFLVQAKLVTHAVETGDKPTHDKMQQYVCSFRIWNRTSTIGTDLCT